MNASSHRTPNARKVASDDVAASIERGDVFFLDVRDAKELESLGTFEGYVNIPLDQLERRLDEVPRDKPIVTA
jgi:hydroxyacylglutathione hydrolase